MENEDLEEGLVPFDLSKLHPDMQRMFWESRLISEENDLCRVPYFGVWHLNVKEAAEYVVLDMWYSGLLPDVQEPECWDGSARDPALLNALEKHRVEMEVRLLSGIENNSLEAAVKLRDLDEKLRPEGTYLSFDTLREWLDERGYNCGDIMAEWMGLESELAEVLCDEITYLRTVSRGERKSIRRLSFLAQTKNLKNLDEAESHDLIAAYKAAVVENKRLKERLVSIRADQPARVDRPVSTRQRRTLLTIVAALCGNAGIDPQARGAAQRIKEMTETLGVPVDDGTISKVLGEIPDALESRAR